MRDVEQLIADWRNSVSSLIKPEALEELEDHLRERMDALVESGADATTAFEQAVREFGSTAQIAGEFKKVEQTIWRPVRIAIRFELLAALIVIGFLPTRMQKWPFSFVLGAHVFFITMGYLTAFGVGALAACFVLQRCVGEISPSKGARIFKQIAKVAVAAALQIAVGFVLGGLWTTLAFGHFWNNDAKEASALVILGCIVCFVIAGKNPSVSVRAKMVLAIACNIVVTAAAFAPMLLERGPNYEFRKAQMLALIVFQLPLIAVGLLPAGWLRHSKRLLNR